MDKLTYTIAHDETTFEPSATRKVVTSQSGRPDSYHTIPVGPSKVRHRETGDMLRVLKGDVNDFLPALEWRCNKQLNIPMPPRSDREGQPINYPGKVYEWRIPGNFSPALNEKKIHAIIQDWKLLGEHFPRYESLFGREAQNKLLAFVEHILLRQEIILAHSTNLKMLNEIREKAQLPEWMKRMIEIRLSGK